MAIELTEYREGRILEAKVNGSLSGSDYERLVQDVGRLAGRHVQVRVLLNLVAFTGWQDEVGWGNLDHERDQLQKVSRLGIVAVVENPDWMATFKQPFTRAMIHVFAPVEKESARAWLEEGIDEKPQEWKHPMGAEDVSGDEDESEEIPPKSEESENKSEPSKSPEHGAWSAWKEQVITAAFLGVLGFFGLVLEYITRTNSWWYWVVITPIFGFVAVRLETEKGEEPNQEVWPLVQKQLFHWAGFIAALPLIAILVRNEVITDKSQGLLTLFFLTLSTYFAGISLNRVFLPTAGVLVVVLLLATIVEKYVFIAFIVLAIGLMGYIVYQKWLSGWFRKKPSPDPFKEPSPPAKPNP